MSLTARMRNLMTSVQNPQGQTTHSVKRPEKSINYGKHGDASADASGEFGALFGAMMEAVPGQNLAAPAAADGQTSPITSGLASEVLGPSVHIITTSEPVTSDESLMAFARSQGMDEEALGMIFGRKAMPDGSAEATAADVLAAAALRSKSVNAGVLSSLSDAAKAAGSDPAAISGGVDLGQDARIGWTLGNAQEGKKAGTELMPTPMFGLNGMRATSALAGNADAAKVEQATHPEAANQSLAASLILGSAEASQFARRLQMKQVTQRAERVADAFPLSRLANTAVSADDPETVVEALTIDTELAPEDLQQLIQQRQPEGRPAGGNEGSTAGGAQAAQRTDIGERAEQYEKLSQRLAEALGQRLTAQIARGDWKVEMALRPIDLGKIDIELTMEKGALQANFSASEAGTRDLIVNGLPKLKEILSQLGMEVATVNVNVRQEGQSGGNPTPGKALPEVAGAAAKRRTVEGSAPADPPAARSMKSSDDGLDVLV